MTNQSKKPAAPSFVIRRQRLKNDGTLFQMEWLTRKNGIIEFSPINRIGNRGGQTVANLMTWKTRAGATKCMNEYASYMEHAKKIGPIEIINEGAEEPGRRPVTSTERGAAARLGVDRVRG